MSIHTGRVFTYTGPNDLNNELKTKGTYVSCGYDYINKLYPITLLDKNKNIRTNAKMTFVKEEYLKPCSILSRTDLKGFRLRHPEYVQDFELDTRRRRVYNIYDIPVVSINWYAWKDTSFIGKSYKFHNMGKL